MKRSKDGSINTQQFSNGKLSHRPSGRQTMLPNVHETPLASTGDKDLRQLDGQKSERATPDKWKKITRRAGEIAMNQGKHSGEVEESHKRRAKRELLGLQTSSDPDDPLAGGSAS